jgi:RNA polymerase sigma factor (sigma-70 family)
MNFAATQQVQRICGIYQGMTLLAQARRGDRAFARLYRRNVGDVYRYALVLLRDPEDAEDVTQTTFLNAYRAFCRDKRPANARAWLLALAHNVCRQRVRAPTVALDEDEAVRAVPDTPPTPAEIRRALAHLPFNQRAALIMRELEGRPYAEIAQVLELSAAAVETLVFEARHALREQLEGALSCHQAERAISLQVDGRLPRAERRPLRAHLRECRECDGFARSQRAQRSAWKTLAAVPLPATLQSFFGPGGMLTSVGNAAGGVAVGAVVKTLAIAAIGAAVVGLGYESRGREALSPAVQVAGEQAAPGAGRPASPAGRPTPAVRPRSRSAPPPRAKESAAPRPVSATPAATPAGLAQASKPARATKRARARPQALTVQVRAKPKPPGHTQTAASSPRQEPEQAAPTEESPAAVGPSPPPPPPPPPPPAVLPLELPQFPPAPPLPLPESPKLP